MLISRDRKALCPVVIPKADMDNSDSTVLYAAKELRWYFGRMTAAVFEILASEEYAGPAVRITRDGRCAGEAYRIVSDADGVSVTGGNRGLLYGVYELLERLGCRFFTKDCEKIPVSNQLTIPFMDVGGQPAFEYRSHNYADVLQSPRFAVRCRLNGSGRIPARMGGSMDYVWFVHTFENMLPVSEFGRTHPEYYALVDGKRCVRNGGRTQLCLTNPDVLRIATERVREALLKYPDKKIISVSQNDWEGNCRCERCLAVDAQEGSPAGTMLRFVNTVAEKLEDEFPDVIFDTLAYMYTRRAPKITGNRKNVCVRLCSIECCFAHPFSECTDLSRSPAGADGMKNRFIDDLRAWGTVCDRMYIWDYTTCFAHYPMPYPNWRVLQPNLLEMAANNVKGVFEQACGASRGSTDFNELRMYLISKLLWDPSCDLARHRREFMEYYYGAAAENLTEYLDLLCDNVSADGTHIHYDDNPVHPYLNEERLDAYDRLFDAAAAAVRGDALRLMRVEKARLSLRWVRIKRKAMLKNEYDAAEIEAFTSDWRAFGLSRIDEWYNLETTHRALLDGHWRARVYFDHWTGEEPEVL